MKILIADKSRSIRLRLGFLLSEFENIETVEVESGKDAVQILEGDDPPQIALIAWMINDLSGIEVCKHVRAENFRGSQDSIPVYIILISSKSKPEDVAEGLLAGADDYVQKPWNDSEFRARIEVALRNIESQWKLKRRCTKAENKLRRIDALGLKARGRKRDSRVSYTNSVTSQSNQPSLVSASNGIISIEKNIVSAFESIGFGEVLASNWDGVHPKLDHHVVWAASILDDVDMWMDFLVRIDRRSLEFVHKKMKSQATKDEYYLEDALLEVAEIAQTEIEGALRNHNLHAWPVCTPAILTSHALDLPPVNLEYAEQIQLQAGEADIFVTVMDEESPVREVTLRELEVHQVLVEDFYSTEDRETPLMRKGTSIEQSHLNRLFDLGWDPDSTLYLTIMKPSALGKLAKKVLSISMGEY